MTTDRQLVCPDCSTTHESAGRPATFACESCGAEISNPFASGKPVAKPVGKPVAKPVAKPAAKPAGRDVPTTRMEQLPEGEDEAFAPSARPAPMPTSRAEGGRAHTRVMGTYRPDFAEKKKPPYAVIGVAAVAVIGVAAFFMMRGGDKPKTPADSGTVAPTGATAGSGTAGATGNQGTDAAKPTDAPVTPPKPAADMVKYDDALEPFVKAPYIPDFARDPIEKDHQFLLTAAAANGGMIKKKDFDNRVAPVLEKYGKFKTRYDEVAASEFGKSAATLGESIVKDISDVFGSDTKFSWYIHPDFKPYVVVIEESPAWSTASVVDKDVFRPLNDLHNLFLGQYEKSNNLTRLTAPVPAIYFASKPNYEKYNESRGFSDKNVLAHFEPASGRLVLHRECSHRVVMHEGTHQLFSRYAKNKVAWHLQSYWFEEGMAEWFGGANRLPDGEGNWKYEIGVIQGGRVNGMRAMEPGKYFKLRELTAITYVMKEKWKAAGGEGQTKIGLIYEQGWFLIYFLNYFDVDAQGYVKIGAKGKYADGWDQYVKGELNGKTGKKAFEEALGLKGDADWDRLEKEYLQYFDFINYKLTRNHTKDDRLIPYSEYRNKRGEATGEKEDDLLIRPKKPEDK